jgi:thiamine biosynthesis lipoprotein
MQDVPLYMHGNTMGTTYSIKSYIPRYKDDKELHLEIKNRLKAINQSMSTYIKNSEISLFNKHNSTLEFKISSDFFKVIKEAKKLHKLTNGYWDGSIYPLIQLWGFEKNKNIKKEPSKQDINDALKLVDFSKIKIKYPNIIYKENPKMKIDLSSIAKGYGVDEISKILNNHKLKSYFVEIGGEIYIKGVKHNNKKWRVGIHSPNLKDIKNKIFTSMELKDKAIATSGNYRNYIEIKGKKYGHIINPKSKKQIKTNIVSASVIANNTMFADGLATAFMLMDENESREVVNNLKDVEMYLIKRENNNSFTLIR